MTDRNELAQEGAEPEATHRPPVITAAWIVFAGLIIAGLMVWQPWAKPAYDDVKVGPNQSVSCMTYKFSVDCGR